MVDVLKWFAADFDRFLGLLVVIAAIGWSIGVARGKQDC